MGKLGTSHDAEQSSLVGGGLKGNSGGSMTLVSHFLLVSTSVLQACRMKIILTYK